MDSNRETISIVIGRIIARSISGTITPTEQAILDDWLQDDMNRKIYAAISNRQSFNERLSAFDAFDMNEGYERFQLSVGKNRRIRPWTSMLAVAAIFVFLAAAVVIYINTATRNERDRTELTALPGHDIAPGGNRATLTLTDGRTITLDEDRDRIVIGNDEITYKDGNSLAEIAVSKRKEAQAPLLELSTPRGGTYQIMLPDGTEVWLNAASTLKYPPRFSNAERIVELTGEAYFSIAKDTKRPFKVVSAEQEIHVLGTEFNISAYPNDSQIKTTLVKGKVRLWVMGKPGETIHGTDSYVELFPGEQGIIEGESLFKTDVDTALYTAWRGGYFYFKKTPLEEILKQAARWYDIEVVYQDGVPDETFSGDIKRDVSLRGLLDILQRSTINVTLEERTLIVHK